MTTSATHARQFSRLAITLLVGCFLVGCSSGPPRVPPAKPLKHVDTFPLSAETNPLLRQIWSYPRFGVLLDIGETDWRLFHRAGRYCWQETNADIKTDFAAFITENSLMSDGSSVRFRSGRNGAELEMKPLELLPPDCDKPKSRIDVYDAFSELLRKHYPFFSRRGITYVAQSADVRRSFSELNDDDALLAAMQASLVGLKDPKLAIIQAQQRWVDPASRSIIDRRLSDAFASQSIIPTEDEYSQRWQNATREGLQRSFLAPGSVNGAPGLLWGTDNNGLGFIRLDQSGTLDPSSIADTLDAAFAALAETPAGILDLSAANALGNGAGMALLGDLLGGRKTAYLGRYHEVPAADWAQIQTQGRKKSFQPPLYVLVSEFSADDAERVALALHGRPGVLIVGGQTRGSTADIIVKSLPNGWVLQIPAIEYADSNEVSYEGVGIAPDFALELYRPGQLTRGHPVALQTLSDLIAEGHFAAR